MRKNNFIGNYGIAGPVRCRNGGFTLVELMIAVFLSLFLMAGVIQLFVQSKTTYTMHEGVARLKRVQNLTTPH